MLCDYKVDIAEQLAAFIGTTETPIYSLTTKRATLVNCIRHCHNGYEIDGYKAERSDLTSGIIMLRKNLKSAKIIISQSDTINHNIRLQTRRKIANKNIQNRKHEIVRL